MQWSARLWSALSTEWSPENGGQWTSAETAFLYVFINSFLLVPWALIDGDSVLSMQISTLIFAPAFLAAGWVR